ncbi:hypothetical protein ABFA07_011617 [Porites harrisoni]
MNLTLCLLLLGILLFSSSCISSVRTNRLKRKHRKQAFNRFQGVLFSKATHYLPLNFTREDKTKLVDMRGNATGMVFNTINASTAEQIGQVLRLNGIDNYIELNNLKDECTTNPSKCTEGLSVAFWIKYTEGKFIISAGRYTDIADDGPGFRFICSNCSRNSGVPETHNSGIFLLELSTTTKKWQIHLDTIPRWWFHFAFTWSPNQGLKYYKNGKFVLGKKNPERFMVATDTNIAKMITIGLPNSLKAMSRKNSRGKFSLGHLVIWTYEVSKYDMEIAFRSVLTTGIKSLLCCQQLKEDPCVLNPCHDGATCQRMDTGDKYQCICPDIDHNGRCSGAEKFAEHCEDKSDQCEKLASQEGFCDYRWRRMKKICPKACKLCATHQSSKLATTSSLPATLSPNSSQGGQNIQMTTLFTGEAPTSPPVQGKLEDEDGKGLSQELLILMICAGIGGLILISIVMACVFTRFYRQRKGEFVPDKTYPSPPNNKHNGDAVVEDLENIDTFIDPSTQITDVPHKPTRGSAGGSSAGGPKKQRKPMGVKVTYKPPEWD